MGQGRRRANTPPRHAEAGLLSATGEVVIDCLVDGVVPATPLGNATTGEGSLERRGGEVVLCTDEGLLARLEAGNPLTERFSLCIGRGYRYRASLSTRDGTSTVEVHPDG